MGDVDGCLSTVEILSSSLSRLRREKLRESAWLLIMADPAQQQVDNNLDDCSLYGSWIFSVMGALLAIPVGIRRKSFAPLVFFGSTGAMLDIVQSITDCERERHEREQAAMVAEEDRKSSEDWGPGLAPDQSWGEDEQQAK